MKSTQVDLSFGKTPPPPEVLPSWAVSKSRARRRGPPLQKYFKNSGDKKFLKELGKIFKGGVLSRVLLALLSFFFSVLRKPPKKGTPSGGGVSFDQSVALWKFCSIQVLARGPEWSLQWWGYPCNFRVPYCAYIKHNALCCTKQDWPKLYCMRGVFRGPLSTSFLPFWPLPFHLDEISRKGWVFRSLLNHGLMPVAGSIFGPLSQTHFTKSEFKNGHISRFCFIFQVIQVISLGKFSFAEEVDFSFISWIWIHESDFKSCFLEKRLCKSFSIQCSNSGINESTPQTQSNVIWISSKAELEISFLNSLLEKWVWESDPKIDPATGVQVGPKTLEIQIKEIQVRNVTTNFPTILSDLVQNAYSLCFWYLLHSFFWIHRLESFFV